MPAPTQIGPFVVEREIGRGGMGVVFLARDTHLNRPVALKALPDEVASDPERLIRFEREARLLATLNHPNVATIYGVEVSDGRRYLALEYLEGESLSTRLQRGPLSIDETLEIGAQVAAGVEAAHDAGIVHRDLKPGNVVLTTGDRVKVVDFGLARGRPISESDAPVLASSPTLTRPQSESSPSIAGVVLGTAPYLSPEQARGKIVDRRTDIWSFGCLLYECLTGTMAFHGETVTDTMAKILERDVDWSKLPKQTPATLRALLARCLVKDPRRRLRDIGEARLTLEDVRSGAHVAGGLGSGSADSAERVSWFRRHRAHYLVAGLAGFLFAAALWSVLDSAGGRRSDPGPAILSVVLPEDLRVIAGEITRDGRSLLFMATQAGEIDPKPRLFVRRIDKPELEMLPGTEGVAGFGTSPDSRSVSFAIPLSGGTGQRRRYTVSLDGRSPPLPQQTFAETWRGGVWLESGEYVFIDQQGREFALMPPDGGPPKKFPIHWEGFEGRISNIRAIRGDRGVLIQAASYREGAYHFLIAVLDLSTRKAKVLIEEGGSPVHLPPNHLLFTRGTGLFAVPFDGTRLELKGTPVGILDGLYTPLSWTHSAFGGSWNGILVYVPGGDVSLGRRAVIVGRSGDVTEWSPERLPFEDRITLSPDGSRLVTVLTRAKGINELWVSDRGRPWRRALAVPGVDCSMPVWSPDGTRLAFSERALTASDGIYVMSVDGATPLRRVLPIEYEKGDRINPTSWSADGSRLLLECDRNRNLSVDMVTIAEGSAGTPKRIGGAGTRAGRFSPDGLVAYTTEETGRPEIGVIEVGPNGPVGEPVLVSVGGGTSPRWSADGKQIYYVTPQLKIVEVAISRSPGIRASAPVIVWDAAVLRIVNDLFEITPDGKLVAIQRGEREGEIKQVDVVMNFDQMLKSRIGKNR